MNKIKDLQIHPTSSVKEALKKLDLTAEKVLLVVNAQNQLLGTLTDGDVRSHILHGRDLEEPVEVVYNKDPIFLQEDEYSLKLAKKILLQHKIDLLPIVDKKNIIIDYLSWDRSLAEHEIPNVQKVETPVVIMAGGQGKRLDPFTKILPKPLIPVGEKPIIEIIIDEFKKFGINQYYLTLNYKGEIIESFFENIRKDYEVHYIWEKDYLGTAGSLKLLEKQIADPFIVSNCDIIVKADFEEIVEFHKKSRASLTIISSIKHYRIPYGVVQIQSGGDVSDILEKPEYTFIVNTGLYIISQACLRFIPPNTDYDMTDLVSSLIKNNKKVVTFPVNENDYIDIGQWEEYKKTIASFDRLGI